MGMPSSSGTGGSCLCFGALFSGWRGLLILILLFSGSIGGWWWGWWNDSSLDSSSTSGLLRFGRLCGKKENALVRSCHAGSVGVVIIGRRASW